MKKIQKLLAFLLILTLIFPVLSMLPTGVFADDVVTLNVYNWGEYISDGSEGSLNVNKAFEEYYKATFGVTVRVNYTTYEDNESLYAKLKNGARGYDIVVPSDYTIAMMIKEDMLAELNFDNIPNYQYIEDDFRDLYYDPENKYSVPYTYGVVGIIYDETAVDKEDVTGWDLLWNDKYAGQILQFNNYRDAFGTAMYKLGIDVNTTDEQDWLRAFEELEKQNPLVQSYVMDQIYDKLESGMAAIGCYYAGDYFTMYDVNENLRFCQPDVTNVFVDAMCIPKTAEHKEIAERYINFMLSEEPAIANAEYIYYGCPNSLVYKNEAYIEEMGEYAMSILYPEGFNFKETFNQYGYRNLDPDTLTYVTNLWNQLKITAEAPVGIYVTAGAIVLAVIVLGIVYAVNRHNRRKLYE